MDLVVISEITILAETNNNNKIMDLVVTLEEIIILEETNNKVDSIWVDKVDLDLERGVMVYEVEFRVGNMEYEYEINAKSGKILKAEKDRDD